MKNPRVIFYDDNGFDENAGCLAPIGPTYGNFLTLLADRDYVAYVPDLTILKKYDTI